MTLLNQRLISPFAIRFSVGGAELESAFDDSDLDHIIANAGEVGYDLIFTYSFPCLQVARRPTEQEEAWFVVADQNWHLYLLQRAAAPYWPLSIGVPVTPIPRAVDFATFSSAKSVLLSEGPAPGGWMWRTYVEELGNSRESDDFQKALVRVKDDEMASPSMLKVPRFATWPPAETCQKENSISLNNSLDVFAQNADLQTAAVAQAAALDVLNSDTECDNVADLSCDEEIAFFASPMLSLTSETSQDPRSLWSDHMCAKREFLELQPGCLRNFPDMQRHWLARETPALAEPQVVQSVAIFPADSAAEVGSVDVSSSTAPQQWHVAPPQDIEDVQLEKLLETSLKPHTTSQVRSGRLFREQSSSSPTMALPEEYWRLKLVQKLVEDREEKAQRQSKSEK